MLDDNNYIKEVRIGLLGDDSAGKSSICKVFSGCEFNPDLITTNGSEKFEKKYSLKNWKEIKVHFLIN